MPFSADCVTFALELGEQPSGERDELVQRGAELSVAERTPRC